MRARPISIRSSALFVALGAALLAAPGCRTMTDVYGSVFLSGELIDYAQYQQVDPEAKPQPSVDDVINTLGKPMAIRDQNGARVRLDYHAYGLDDSLKRAEFHFNQQEKLVKKVLW